MQRKANKPMANSEQEVLHGIDFCFSLSIYCRCRSQASGTRTRTPFTLPVAVAAESVQLRQVLLISEIKWRTPNHGQKRSKTHIKLRHNAPASLSLLFSSLPALSLPHPSAVGATRTECIACNFSVINIQVLLLG